MQSRRISGVTLLEAMLPVIVPWMAILLAQGAATSVHTIPMIAMGQAGQYVFLLVPGGQLFLGLALLIASIVWQYTAPVVRFGLFVFIAFVFDIPALRSYSPWVFMMGANHLDRHTYLPVGPIPIGEGLAFILMGGASFSISVKMIEKRDF